ncbi:MAG TPA: Fic family protein [Deltaproteobacteria bacterium]|nr:Fic family protein [Deltaproteobacteria bacterium]
MEPMMPEESRFALENLALELVEKAVSLARQIHPLVQSAIGNLVRSMNCYYSNLIEGHETHPRDIERALAKNFSKQPKQRDLQLEAKAHIEVQRMIDDSEIAEELVSESYLCWIHREFEKRLPEEMLWVEDPDTKKREKIIPGQLRNHTVVVGRHIPPRPENLKSFLRRFQEAYHPRPLSKLRRVIAVAASHHRLLWIHPFLDGNGRVTRLYSHAYFKLLGLGNSLWSVSRGLARNAREYKSCIEAADSSRRGDFDGRGTLSARGLEEFCEFFLKSCIDQVEYMSSLLDLAPLMSRIQLYCEEESREGRLPKKSFLLLREALLVGEFERGRAEEITGYSDRQARRVLASLEQKKLLVSETPKGAMRLAFPVNVVERWFPRLYPSG